MADKILDSKQTKQDATKQRAPSPAGRERGEQTQLPGNAGFDAETALAGPAQVLALQHIAGNHAVSRLIQTKLTVGRPARRYPGRGSHG